MTAARTTRKAQPRTRNCLPWICAKKHQEGDDASEPDPWLEEHGAMSGKQQASDHAGCEKDDAILVLKGYTCNEAEPQPQFLIARLDYANQNKYTSHPGQRFEGIH